MSLTRAGVSVTILLLSWCSTTVLSSVFWCWVVTTSGPILSTSPTFYCTGAPGRPRTPTSVNWGIYLKRSHNQMPLTEQWTVNTVLDLGLDTDLEVCFYQVQCAICAKSVKCAQVDHALHLLLNRQSDKQYLPGTHKSAVWSSSNHLSLLIRGWERSSIHTLIWNEKLKPFYNQFQLHQKVKK